jgi:hypothetical protein
LNLYNQKQVIYLINSPLSERDFNRFGIKNWVNKGWKVNVFDCTFFLFPKFWKFINGDKLSYNFEGLKIFHNINEALAALQSLENKVVYIDFLGFSAAETQIRKVAQRNGVLVRMLLGSIPEAKSEKIIFKIFSLIKNPIFIFKKLIFFIQKKLEQIRAKRNIPDYLVVGGTKSMLDVNNKKTLVIKAHNFDYDFFIKEKQNKLNKKEKFLVFLDEDGSYHSDFVRLGIKPFVTADKYFPVIDLGLSEIAKSLKLNIKIAAHPRSNYNVKQIKYKHTIIENKTFELIKDADVVVAHMSTAIQWAVIMKKPIIFVTTNEIENSSYGIIYAKNIKRFTTELGKKVVNLNDVSKIINWKDYLSIDKEKYKKYIDNYVKFKGSPQKLLWDIVIKYIEKDLFLKKIKQSKYSKIENLKITRQKVNSL